MALAMRPNPVLFSAIIGLIIILPELIIHITKQSQLRSSHRKDRFSLASLWTIILSSIVVAIPFGYYLIPESLYLPLDTWGTVATLTILFVGLFLRCWAIYTLGSFFTVHVAIHQEHKIISKGPYALIRHPSYTGLLLELLALALSYQHALSLGIIMVPAFIMLLIRIQMEERVLREHLGEDYRFYQKQTYVLFPYLY